VTASAKPETHAVVLPDSLHEMTALVGMSDTLRLVRAYGGTRLWVPADITPDHPFSTLLGHAQARAISARFGNTYIDIPRCAGVARAARDAEIQRRYASGETQNAIALAYGLTERRVREIVSAR